MTVRWTRASPGAGMVKLLPGAWRLEEPRAPADFAWVRRASEQQARKDCLRAWDRAPERSKTWSSAFRWAPDFDPAGNGASPQRSRYPRPQWGPISGIPWWPTPAEFPCTVRDWGQAGGCAMTRLWSA